MTDQHRIIALDIEHTIGFHSQFVTGQHLPAGERQGFCKRDELRSNHADRTGREGDVRRGCQGGSSRCCGNVGYGKFGHMDLFSWIYEAPASRSSKSALIRKLYFTTLEICPIWMWRHRFIRGHFTYTTKIDTFDQ